MRSSRRLFVGICLALLVATPHLAADADLAARLAGLTERMDQRREELHIPGMSLVVVKDGEVVLARGFGVTDLATNDPVSAATPFMIGSTTKAFTATLAGMLVDEGKLAWDAPMVSYLPYFDPRVDRGADVAEADAHVTLRDALSHRSGFTRMGILLTARDMPPREVLEVANGAEPWDEFRAHFHYNNIMYVAAGTAAGEAGGSDWHKLLRKRLLKPLGMKDSSSLAKQSRGELVPGYSWLEDLGEHQRQPILTLDVAGPAGSIVSNAGDMGHWLRFLLARGEYGGKRLIEAATLEETWKPNVTIAEGVGYGMGWMTRTWDGRDFVEHGGNINGFAAQVGLMPDANVGFALLTNLSATPLQQESLTIVWEELLGTADDAVAAGEAAAGDDLAALVGEYAANFGPFSDATFTVSEKDGVLFVDVPGQTNYEIKPPGEDGRRPFAVTDTVAVSFETNAADTVVMMRMHQGGLDFEIPRRGVDFPVELDPAEFRPFLGTYQSAVFNMDVMAKVVNDRLALDVPGQMTFELHVPDDDGRRRFRVRDAMSVTFETAEDGAVTAAVLRRDDEVVDTMPRVGEPDLEPLPTLDDLMAVRASDARRAAYEALGALRTTSKVRLVNAGLVGRATQWFDGDRVRSDLDFGKFGWQRTALTPELGVTLTNVTPREEFTGRRLRAALGTERVAQILDWRDGFETVRVLEREELEGLPVIRVRLENPESPAITVYVDPATGDVRKVDGVLPIPAANAEFPLTVYLDDYREQAGIRVPYRTTIESEMTGRMVLALEKFEHAAASCKALTTLTEDTPCDGFPAVR